MYQPHPLCEIIILGETVYRYFNIKIRQIKVTVIMFVKFLLLESFSQDVGGWAERNSHHFIMSYLENLNK